MRASGFTKPLVSSVVYGTTDEQSREIVFVNCSGWYFRGFRKKKQVLFARAYMGYVQEISNSQLKSKAENLIVMIEINIVRMIPVDKKCHVHV